MAFSADSYEKRCNILCNKGVTFDVTHDFKEFHNSFFNFIFRHFLKKMLHVTKFLKKVGFCYIVTPNVTAETIEN